MAVSDKQFGQCLDSWKKRKEELLTEIPIELKMFQITTKEQKKCPILYPPTKCPLDSIGRFLWQFEYGCGPLFKREV